MFKLVFVLTFVSVVLAIKNMQFRKAREESKYYFSENLLQFEEARNACKSNGWTLATEKSTEETVALNSDIALMGNGKDFYWLAGARDEKNNSKWIWVDSGEEFTYTHWQDGEPYYDTAYNCLLKQAQHTYKGFWGTDMCVNDYGGTYFICQES